MTDSLESLSKKGVSCKCFVNCARWESSLLLGTYFISVESMPGKYRKSLFLILRIMFRIEHIFPQTRPCCMQPIFLQLDVRFLCDSNNWNINGTPNLGTVKQMLRILSQLASDNVLVQPGVDFFT